MKLRHILIIIMSILILIAFSLVSSISYNMGVSYGEENAEIIRKSRITDSLLHEKTSPIVNIKKIVNSDIISEITSSGRVLSLNNITITSEVNGKLEGNYSIKKGVKFKKGDVLFRIKNTEMKLLVDAKKSNFMNLISSNLADIKMDFPEEYEKWNTFFGSITLDNKMLSFPTTNSSKEKNFISSRRILSEYLSLKSDEEKLRKYTVLAPFNGVISKSYTDISANVNVGSPIIDIIRNGKMEVELTVNTSEIDLISIGNKVILLEGDNTFEGNITRKGGFVNENTQNISVFVEVSSKSVYLYNGMYLEAIIETKLNKSVSTLPRRSLISENEVFIVNELNKLEKKTVNIISEQGTQVIIDNLEENTNVVIEPLINTKEGTIVNPILK